MPKDMTHRDKLPRRQAEAGSYRPLLAALLATAAISMIAVLFPQIDLWASALFYEPGQGFPLTHDTWLLALRSLGRVVPGAVVGLLVLLVAMRVWKQQPLAQLSDRGLLFLASCMALGPGLLVNLILKSYWGRVRPISTGVFGGTQPFTPAWWPWGGCHANCSFVSGEASTAMVLIAVAFVAPANWRRSIVVATLIWTALISLNRVAFGAHFLSDVVISCGLTLAVILALKALILDRGGLPAPARAAQNSPDVVN